jgi:hypothetical protein
MLQQSNEDPSKFHLGRTPMTVPIVAGKRTGLSALLMFILLFAGACFAGDLESLIAKAGQQGVVPVIVELELPTPFIPEGAHASARGREQQREAIINARERFFNRPPESIPNMPSGTRCPMLP